MHEYLHKMYGCCSVVSYPCHLFFLFLVLLKNQNGFQLSVTILELTANTILLILKKKTVCLPSRVTDLQPDFLAMSSHMPCFPCHRVNAFVIQNICILLWILLIICHCEWRLSIFRSFTVYQSMVVIKELRITIIWNCGGRYTSRIQVPSFF